jgi:hypothetical protein
MPGSTGARRRGASHRRRVKHVDRARTDNIPMSRMGLSFDDAHRGLRRVNAGILRPNKRSPGVFRWITAVVWP